MEDADHARLLADHLSTTMMLFPKAKSRRADEVADFGSIDRVGQLAADAANYSFVSIAVFGSCPTVVSAACRKKIQFPEFIRTQSAGTAS